jgi:hypothetical protein
MVRSSRHGPARLRPQTVEVEVVGPDTDLRQLSNHDFDSTRRATRRGRQQGPARRDRGAPEKPGHLARAVVRCIRTRSTSSSSRKARDADAGTDAQAARGRRNPEVTSDELAIDGDTSHNPVPDSWPHSGVNIAHSRRCARRAAAPNPNRFSLWASWRTPARPHHGAPARGSPPHPDRDVEQIPRSCAAT